MNPGLRLVAALLQHGGADRVIAAGITPDMLPESERAPLRAVLEHDAQYGKVPSRAALAELLPDDVMLDIPESVEEPIDFYIEQVRKRSLSARLISRTRELTTNLQEGNPDRALQIIEELSANEMFRADARRGKVTDITTTFQDRLDDYRHRRELNLAGKIAGIPTPWPTINRLTMGLENGTFTVLVGRIYSGKSWLLICMATHAWEILGESPVFASMEMTTLQVGRRIDAIMSEVTYTDLVSGLLPTESEERHGLLLKEYAGRPPFYCVGKDLVRTVDDLVRIVRRLRPRAGVYLDGVNRISAGSDQDRYRRVAEASDELKATLGIGCNIPVIGTTHFNKEGGKKSQKSTGADLEEIGYAYAIGEQVDNGFALIQTPDMHADRTVLIKKLKTREEAASNINGVVINFNHDCMDFSEIGPWDGTEIDASGDGGVPF